METKPLIDAIPVTGRVEGRAKVTGSAKYAAEYQPAERCFGVLVTSTIARGRITGIDTGAAMRVRGVVDILSHLNRPDVPGWNKPTPAGNSRVEGQEFRLFFDDRIYHDHQPVALVIAETLEAAAEAASLVTLSYVKERSHTELSAHTGAAIQPKRSNDHRRGGTGSKPASAVRLVAIYHTPLQVHNPLETHAATVDWKQGKLTDYNKTQASKLAQQDIAKAFGLPPGEIEVHSPFVGGAFGSSSRIWPPEMAALMAAKKTGRPVTVMATRRQAFNMVGYRPASTHELTIEALKDGQITTLRHDVVGGTSTYEEFTERVADPTKTLYNIPDLQTTYRLVPLDMSTPCWTRGPGETSGSFALESAMDELSYQLQIDPLALRLKNFAEADPEKSIPWSSNHLKACYEKGAAAFQWHRRPPKPGTLRTGEWMTGMGMAAGIYKSERAPATATATFRVDGTWVVQSSVADVGPGSATIMTQIAAQAAGTAADKIQFEWGNSGLPPAPGQFGSHTTASVGTSVYEAVKAVQQRIIQMAASEFAGIDTTTLQVNADVISTGTVRRTVAEILQKQGLREVSVTQTSTPVEDTKKVSGKSYVAHFVELRVNAYTGVVQLVKVVTAIDAGRIINHHTARSQVYGAITWGIGIALMEEGKIDHRYGRYVNNNLADYHVPVQADMPEIEVIFIDEPDPHLGPMGAKGIGEIGLIGFTAAIANAVYHATGKRFRSLPITPASIFKDAV